MRVTSQLSGYVIPDRLRTGARRLARKSVNRLRLPAVAREVEKLVRLMELERETKLRQGDALVVLIDRHGLRPVDVARATGARSNAPSTSAARSASRERSTGSTPSTEGNEKISPDTRFAARPSASRTSG